MKSSFIFKDVYHCTKLIPSKTLGMAAVDSAITLDASLSWLNGTLKKKRFVISSKCLLWRKKIGHSTSFLCVVVRSALRSLLVIQSSLSWMLLWFHTINKTKLNLIKWKEEKFKVTCLDHLASALWLCCGDLEMWLCWTWH